MIHFPFFYTALPVCVFLKPNNRERHANFPFSLTLALKALKKKTQPVQYMSTMKATNNLDVYKRAHSHTRKQNSGDGNWLLVSATFHSGLSRPGVPGLRPTAAYALGKHYHLGYMESGTHSPQIAIQHLNPVTHAACD